MRNAKRLLAALLLAAALILSSASCGGQTETASEAPAAASSEPQRDYTVQISKDTLRRKDEEAAEGKVISRGVELFPRPSLSANRGMFYIYYNSGAK